MVRIRAHLVPRPGMNVLGEMLQENDNEGMMFLGRKRTLQVENTFPITHATTVQLAE